MGGENLDWLPEGWQVKKRNGSYGRKDKYYVNPSNGMKFNSKPEVIRYLESSVKDCKSIEERNTIKIEKTVAKTLPPGWIKEIKTKKKGSKTRRDPYYIDPVSGRSFRSMTQVFRYLESKDQEKAELKPDGKYHVSVELGDPSQSSSGEANTHGLTGDRMKEVNELAENKPDKSVNRGQPLESGSKVTPIKKVDTPVVEQRGINNDSAGGNLPNKQSQVNGKEQHGSECAAEKSINMLPENNDFEKREKDNNNPAGGVQQLENPVSKNKRKTSTDLPRRTSKRLARRSKDYPSPEVKARDGTSASLSGSKVAALEKVNMPIAKHKDTVAANLPNKLPQENESEQHNGGGSQITRLVDSKLEDNNVTKDQSLQSVIADLEAAPKRRSITNPENNFFFQIPKKENKRKTPNKKLTRSDLPRRTSKRLLSQVNNASSPQVKIQNNAEDSSATLLEAHTTKNVGDGGASEMDPTGKLGPSDSKRRPENQTNNKQEKPINGNLCSPDERNNVGVNSKGGESQEKHLDPPLKDLFTDPCIEFAVKTLTGAIPIEELNKFGYSQAPFSSLASPNQTSASSTVVPPDDIWADPCFGFAVNMLTDETHMNDSSKAQISFQQPMFRLDNGYPLHGQFDAVKKQPFVGQQDVGNDSFSYATNGSSQNSVRRSG